MVLVDKGALLNLFCNKDTYEEGRFDTTIKDFVHINSSLISWMAIIQIPSLLDFSAPAALRQQPSQVARGALNSYSISTLTVL
jgi:hypothetical protein